MKQIGNEKYRSMGKYNENREYKLSSNRRVPVYSNTEVALWRPYAHKSVFSKEDWVADPDGRGSSSFNSQERKQLPQLSLSVRFGFLNTMFQHRTVDVPQNLDTPKHNEISNTINCNPS